ncbi:hypothetical protein GLS40_01125 [Pseudooceanicola sp. 216_PA32_1]|uniref:Secreted protein n=1 Tax=Pseudooceanicola pacificus TaxID=2676438 RepID=A0A844WD03_9RHOB|nr:hypothetical protein [Pseudooceanicola pacificus]MWB76619.1 hypothetical protein [Pseudooceanicola pacificus]
MKPVALTLVWLLALFGPQAAMSAPIEVRTGDHDGFTRVVFYLLKGERLRVTANSGRILVRRTEAGGFDTSGIFDRITRARVSSATASDRSMELRLACDCAILREFDQGGVKVIDIGQGSTGQKAANQLSFGTAVASDSPDASRHLMGLERSARSLTFPDRSDPTQVAGETVRDPMPHRPGDGDIESPAATPISHNKLLDELRSDLMARLTDATNRGLLVPESLPNDRHAGESGISATPLDRAILPQPEHSTETDEAAARCGDPVHNPLLHFDSDVNFRDVLAEKRSEVTDDLEDSDTSRKALARVYANFGFGIEAISVLDTLRHPDREAAALRQLAAIVDGEPMTGNEELLKSLACDPSFGVWSAIAGNGIATLDEGTFSDLMSGLAILARPLRNALYERLRAELLASGKTDRLAQLSRMMEQRAAGSDQTVTSPARDAHAPSPGVPQHMASTSEPGPLAADIEGELQSGANPDLQKIELLDSYALQERGTEEASRLTYLAMLARARRGDLRQVIEDLPKAMEFYDSFGSADVISPIVAAALETAEAGQSLWFISALQTIFADNPDAEISALLNREAAQLGMPGLTAASGGHAQEQATDRLAGLPLKTTQHETGSIPPSLDNVASDQPNSDTARMPTRVSEPQPVGEGTRAPSRAEGPGRVSTTVATGLELADTSLGLREGIANRLRSRVPDPPQAAPRP